MESEDEFNLALDHGLGCALGGGDCVSGGGEGPRNVVSVTPRVGESQRLERMCRCFNRARKMSDDRERIVDSEVVFVKE